MSNLSRLQAVSSSLDTAINKANNLPSGGSSGGNTSIETCTLTLEATGPTFGDEGVIYINENQAVDYAFFDLFEPPTVTVQKNSIILLCNVAVRLSGNISCISYEGVGTNAYFITGNATMTVL